MAMTESPASLDAILASIRARVMAPDDGEDGDGGTAITVDQPAPVPLAHVELTASSASMTLDDLVRSMLGPLIQAWLDANMPEIVEKLAREEIRRLTGKL
jgi:cell pole-organizing protein PopZ